MKATNCDGCGRVWVTNEDQTVSHCVYCFKPADNLVLTVPTSSDLSMDANGRLYCKCPTCDKEFTSVESYIDSRSRFKEETIKALERDIHYEESQIEDAVQEREGGTEGEIEESEIKIRALKEAIETIKSL